MPELVWGFSSGLPQPSELYGPAHITEVAWRPVPHPNPRAGQCMGVCQLNSKCEAPMLPSHWEQSLGHWDIAGSQRCLLS